MNLTTSPSFNFKIRTLQIVNHIVAVVGFIFAAQHNQLHLINITIILYYLFGALGIVCGLHRLLSHKSFSTNKYWEYLLSFISIFATVGSTITWVALHRLHHTNAEKPNDPHSPYINRGAKESLKFSFYQAFKSWVGIWSIPNIPVRYSLPYIKDSFHIFIHKHYFKIIMSYCFLLALINPWLVLFAYVFPACMCLHSTSVVIVIAHIHGYKTHKINDESRNSWICSLVTMGDGWHNNHHANPGNWTTQEKWWELDPCGWFIWLIKDKK